MKKFLIVYRSSPEAVAQRDSITPEQREEGMQMWLSWKETIGANLVDFGSPLTNGTKLHKDGSSEPGSKNVTGYSIIRAKDMDEAKSLLYNHPCFGSKDGCDVEVHECVTMY